MSKKAKEPKFRVELRDRRGRFVSLSKAYTVSIFYGKKRILEPHSIPREWKARKRRTVINQILIDYLLKLEIEEEKQQQKKKLQALKKEKPGRVYQSKRIVKKRRVRKGVTTYYEEEEFVDNWFESDVKTYSDEYTKKLHYKWITARADEDTPQPKKRTIIQLDFSLNQPIELDYRNYQDYKRSYYYMIRPHIIKFILEYGKKGYGEYIFRIKFQEDRKDKKGNIFKIKNGAGTMRITPKNSNELFKEIRKLFDRFFQYDFNVSTAKKYLSTSYTRLIYLSGFSIETTKAMGHV